MMLRCTQSINKICIEKDEDTSEAHCDHLSESIDTYRWHAQHVLPIRMVTNTNDGDDYQYI